MKNQFKILAIAAILLLTLAVCIASAIGANTLLGAANAAPMSLAAIAVLFRPKPTPPPFAPPTPTPEIVYPVDIDAFSKIQFGEFSYDEESFDAVVDAVDEYWTDDYEYQEIHYTNDGINFTQVNITRNMNSDEGIYLQIPNVEVVSQAIGWYLKIFDAGNYNTYYMAVTLN